MKTFKELLMKLPDGSVACEAARVWAADKTIEEVVSTCERGEWLLWLAQKVGVPLQELTLAKARCAKTVIHLMKDERSINAVNVAEKFGLGECTLEELKEAAAGAYAAYADAADAYAAATAATAYATADAYTTAYTTAYAAATAAYAAYAAYAAATAAAVYATAAAYAAAYAAAKKENQKLTADICREVIGDLLIGKVNELLKL